MNSFLPKCCAVVACLSLCSPAFAVKAQDTNTETRAQKLEKAKEREQTITNSVLTSSEPSCFGGEIRISALVSTGTKVKVGIVDTASDQNYFVGAGEMAGSVEVVSADYDKEMVVLKRGDQTCTLLLAADPNAPVIQAPAAVAAMEDSPLYRGEAIERFLKEFPGAMSNGMIKFPLPVAPPAVGKGETIEKYLREHPDIAKKVDQPVVGKGEGIESYLRQHPEMKLNDQPIPEGSLGPGIEEMLKKNPQIISNAIPPEVMVPSPPGASP